MKICLLRLHSEREVLRNIIIFIADIIEKGNQENIKINELKEYLSSSTKIIFKKKYYGILQRSILEAVNQCELTVNEADRIDIENKRLKILKQLSTIGRRQTIEKIEKIFNLTNVLKGMITVTNTTTITIGNGNTFTGSFIVSSIIANSFNTTEKATTPNLKEKLEVLVTNISKLCERILSQDKQEQVSRGLDRFTSEAVTQNPDKSFLEVSGKGLVDAAKAVADFVEPVTKAVSAVLAILS